MKKLFIAAFMLVSSFGTNVMADGHAIKMGIILGFTGLFGFVILLIFSYIVEGNTISTIQSISHNSWILIFYQAIVVSLGAHLLMFYLYKFYTVGQIFPSYSLFPIFGIALSYLIFDEVPTVLFILGGIIVIGSVFLLHKIR
mgnify:CR=1 FL=1